MCKYANFNNGECTILSHQCPFVYYCNKIGAWKDNKDMPERCGVALNKETPKGAYRVVSFRHGYIYVNVNGETMKFINPYNTVPLFVKLSKSKDGHYKLKERVE